MVGRCGGLDRRSFLVELRCCGRVLVEAVEVYWHRTVGSCTRALGLYTTLSGRSVAYTQKIRLLDVSVKRYR